MHKRALVWSERACETEDLQGYHAKLKLPARENWAKNIQSTWGALIRILLAFEGKRSEKEDVIASQRNELGKTGGDNAILDLSQLSAPSQKVWSARGSEIEWLKDRDLYEARVLPDRQALFRRRLTEHKPKIVLFFGSKHRSTWETISGVKFAPSELPVLYYGRSEDTLFAVMPHPDSIRLQGKGAKNRRLAEMGSELRRIYEHGIGSA